MFQSHTSKVIEFIDSESLGSCPQPLTPLWATMPFGEIDGVSQIDYYTHRAHTL